VTATVVVSGAASGIGKAVVEALVALGYSVVGVDLRSPDDDIANRVRWVIGDVGMDETWSRIAADLDVSGVTTLSGVVHCAAEQVIESAWTLSADSCARTFSVNVTSVFLSLRALKRWIQAGSAIVNVGSVHALASTQGYALYAASKGALSALSRALAVELGPRKVRVNAVLPGAVDTPMFRAGLAAVSDADQLDALAACVNRQVIRRIAQPIDIARAVVFLLDNERASFITGAELVVDGGGMAALSTADRRIGGL
jgi:glucose 1-dehydrogenase